MYDTVHLWLPNDLAGNLSHLPARLHQGSILAKADGSESLLGSYKGLRITAGNRGVSIKGSLPKHYLGSSIPTLHRQDVSRVVEMLSDELSLPVAEAQVTRLDIAFNLQMTHIPRDYYPLLGLCPRYVRLEQPNTIYYDNSRRSLAFYDKQKEAKKNHTPVPPIVQGVNLLRYELRFTRKVAAQLNLPCLTCGMLSEEAVYISGVDRWHQAYLKIHKQPVQKINLMDKEIKTPKDFMHQMALAMILEYGEDKTMQLIDELRAAGKFEHKEYPSRLKRLIRDALKRMNRESPANDLLTELDKKVQRARVYYR